MKLVKYNNKNAYGSKYPPSYPNEMMVKIFSSKTYGIEINQNLVNLGLQNLKRLNVKIPTIKIGTNTDIPFKKNFLDTLVSINTIHYNSGNEIHKALLEFKRVLKRGGVLYLETIGNKHFAFGKKIKNLSYKSNLKDFRKNHIFGFFDNKLHLKKILQRYFKTVEIFEKNEKTKINLHFYIAVCK